MIHYGQQSIDESDIDAVVKVLKSQFLTQGPTVPKFEKKISNYTGAKHAVAVNSGTSALHIACLALGLQSSDIVWTSPISFVASANCALYCGATIDFVDIDIDTGLLSIKALEKKLIAAQEDNCLPKIIIPVHLTGQAVDLKALHKLSQKYGFHIIEDAAHALGAKQNNSPIGQCNYSDITIFSFHPIKSITSGEGGMATTNSKAIAETMRLYSSHGITKSAELFKYKPKSACHNEQQLLGYNYRMSDIHAALGLSQLAKLDQFIQKRNNLALAYQQKLSHLPISLPQVYSNNNSAYHLYSINLSDELKPKHEQIIHDLLKLEIGVNIHYSPIHLQPYYQKLGFKQGQFPQAEDYATSTITLPLFVTMTEQQQDYIVDMLSSVIEQYQTK